jgi:hypothetical protein
LKHLIVALHVLLFCAGSSVAASATTLASFTGTNSSTAADNYMGMEFTVGPSGNFNDIVFDFLSSGTTPYAMGTGFLFTTPYIGDPNDLSSSDAGFLGSTVASGGYYTFAPDLVLTGGTTYYFYSNYLTPQGFSAGVPSTPSYIYATSATTDFITQPGAAVDFSVMGAATPEPSPLLLLATGVVALFGFRKSLSVQSKQLAA